MFVAAVQGYLLQEESARLAQLVKDVLQLARADAARDTLSRDRIDVSFDALKRLPP